MLKMSEKSLRIYTDGSCIPNPGQGGWGYIALHIDMELHINGGEKNSTNNRMELTAVIEALKDYKTQKSFTFYTDSQYVMNCAIGKYAKKMNRDLWTLYDKYSEGKNIKWVKVKAHNGDKYNELVDALAKSAIVKK